MSHGHGHAEAEGASQESIAAGYEVKDAKARPLVFATIGVFALILLSFALIWGMLFAVGSPSADAFSNRLQPTSEQVPPEPRVEQNPNIDGDRIVSEAAERLNSVGPIEGQPERAHITLERAKELLLEKGVAPFGLPEAQGQAGGNTQADATAAPTTTP